MNQDCSARTLQWPTSLYWVELNKCLLVMATVVVLFHLRPNSTFALLLHQGVHEHASIPKPIVHDDTCCHQSVHSAVATSDGYHCILCRGSSQRHPLISTWVPTEKRPSRWERCSVDCNKCIPNSHSGSIPQVEIQVFRQDYKAA